jgi:hypothetical protein
VQPAGHELVQGTLHCCLLLHWNQDTSKPQSLDASLLGWSELPQFQHVHQDVVSQIHQITEYRVTTLYLYNNNNNKLRVSRTNLNLVLQSFLWNAEAIFLLKGTAMKSY